MEGAALFLFAYTSLERYQTIAGSIISGLTKKNTHLAFLFTVLGVISGSICSTLNTVALSVMTSPPALLLKTCSIPNNVPGRLTLLIIAKVLSLVAMYLVPCSIMSVANTSTAMFLSVKMQSKKNLRKCYSNNITVRKHRSKKTRKITSFLVFSSVFMVCSVSKPIFEVYLAIKAHMGMAVNDERETVSVLLDAITWNLTTIAYAINTITGLRYTK